MQLLEFVSRVMWFIAFHISWYMVTVCYDVTIYLKIVALDNLFLSLWFFNLYSFVIFSFNSIGFINLWWRLWIYIKRGNSSVSLLPLRWLVISQNLKPKFVGSSSMALPGLEQCKFLITTFGDHSCLSWLVWKLTLVSDRLLSISWHVSAMFRDILVNFFYWLKQEELSGIVILCRSMKSSMKCL